MENDEKNIIYDTSILKRNIKKLMDKDDSGLSQTKLAEKFGMCQPRLSKLLNTDTSDCFTVQQVGTIANFFHVSIDSLFGIQPETSEETDQEITLYNILDKLFELDKLTEIEFRNRNVKSFGKAPSDYRPYILFKNEQINKILDEWISLRLKFDELHNTELKNKMFKLWKEDTLNEAKQCPQKYNFLTKRERQKELMDIILQKYEDCPYKDDFHIRLCSEDYTLIQEYYDSFFYRADYPNQIDFIEYLITCISELPEPPCPAPQAPIFPPVE